MGRMPGLLALAAAIAAESAISGTAAYAQDLTKHAFKVVGTWSNLTNYQVNEQPFWSTTLPEASKGQLTANIQPINGLGLKGTEVVRLVRLGLFDFAQALPVYVAEDAIVEGIDIAGVVKSFDEARQTVDAYAPPPSRSTVHAYATTARGRRRSSTANRRSRAWRTSRARGFACRAARWAIS